MGYSENTPNIVHTDHKHKLWLYSPKLCRAAVTQQIVSSTLAHMFSRTFHQQQQSLIESFYPPYWTVKISDSDFQTMFSLVDRQAIGYPTVGNRPHS